MSESTGRRSVNAHTTPFLPNDMEGPLVFEWQGE